MPARLSGNQLSGGDQAFLVGYPDSLSGFDGFVSGFESRDADDGADHEIEILMRCDMHEARRAENHVNVVDSG